MARIPPNWPNARAHSAPRFCCRFRWSRSIIPTTLTLLTSLASEQNLDRLYWHLSRFQGYAGIANFMGARFVVTDAVMQPIVREAAKRGLGYLDDGSAPRSVAPTLAAGQAMPFAKADLSIDAVPTSVEIDRTLAKLETWRKNAEPRSASPRHCRFRS